MVRIRSLVSTCLLAGVAAVASPQAEMSRFEPVGDFELLVEGTVDKEAMIYQSRADRAVLVVSERLPTPVVLHITTRSAQAVPLIRLAPDSNGGVGLRRGNELEPLGQYDIAADGIQFRHGSVEAKLVARPPLVGVHGITELFKHSPEYRTVAGAYHPDSAVLAKLRGVGAGYHVRVVFGSWCSVCKNYLPRGLKVDEALAGGAILFEYFGLPAQGAWEHPEVKRLNVQSLPTAIVYKGTKEIGRFAGAEGWQQPEARLWAAIQSAPPGG